MDLLAQPARGPQAGRGPQSREARGPIDPEHNRLIQMLAANHNAIERFHEITTDGYRARTTSKDPELAAALKSHVHYMKARLDAGLPVRQWDPAFREVFQHHAAIQTEFTDLDNGIEVVVRGTTPEAIAVARNHGKVVSGFVADGPQGVQRHHDRVMQKQLGR